MEGFPPKELMREQGDVDKSRGRETSEVEEGQWPEVQGQGLGAGFL